MEQTADSAIEGAREAAEDAAPADASDPYQRRRQTFPTLNEEQIARIAGYGQTADYGAGEVLFQRGDREADFFLVLEGGIDIIDMDAEGEEKVITTHGVHQFTGELDLFNRSKILVSGQTSGPSRLVRLDRQQFRRMSSTEQDIGELMMRAFILRRTAFLLHDEAAVTVIGEPNGRDTVRIRRFLARNGYPARLLEASSDDAAAYARECSMHVSTLPAVRTSDGRVYHNPSTAELADALGITVPLDPDHCYDLVVIGAGPSGLSAAVYAASEALDTIVIETEAPGGQAGTSSKIENYLGFPTGISGQALAGRAWIQAQKFGATFAIARAAETIKKEGRLIRITTQDGQSVCASAAIVASGATYRKLDLPGYEKFEGQGIHYAATALEAQLCQAQEVVVVGGGNSAGQAAVFLSRHASHVHVLVRSDGLAASMSDYLVSRIEQSSRITLHTETELTALSGRRMLEEVTWRNRTSGEQETKAIGNVFVMIGAVPNTEWLGDCLELDERGFVRTGAAVSPRGDEAGPFDTSEPGIFAVGDVRSGSVKRVASGVGEGSVCISAVHAYLQDSA
ncbi:FAD-dependent oxidoreductase [Parvularcula maris]|uniref:Thioredoxin reductase n=1 Tax=Parvularcula maris TaxID=2965077 RepID=A0A9X2L928_9PROT|nr:cyclic nucleotide-binding domain-containing thioredoxin-disulfide reductase [Parvularcula maris]MCQ8184492.1 FAD-dependent oxidoreductase [Parvularcula maris]